MTKDEAREKLIEEQFEGPIKFGPLACKSTFKSGLEIGFDAGYSAAGNQWKRIFVAPPHVHGIYLISGDKIAGDRLVRMALLCDLEGEPLWIDIASEIEYQPHAWMPLPEPYGLNH